MPHSSHQLTNEFQPYPLIKEFNMSAEPHTLSRLEHGQNSRMQATAHNPFIMSQQLRLEGKVAIITGAASGIGEATARLFASHGATVVIADVQDELGLAVSASIPTSAYRHCDVRNENHVKDTVNYTLATYGRLDVLFSNAGVIGTARSILDASLDDWDDVMAVNARGTAAAVKHAARAMVARGTRGSIVCTASIAASQGYPAPAYAASKHAVLGLVRAAAGELGAYGIRVNCVSPSAVATPLACGFHGGASAEVIEEGGAAASSLRGLVLKAGHVAEAVLFLASEEAAFVTGHNLLVDGGRTVVGAKLPTFDK